MNEMQLMGGKYTLIRHDEGGMEALRYGAPWRSLTGDNLVLALAQRVDTLTDALENLCIGVDMGWDLDGLLGKARAALAGDDGE